MRTLLAITALGALTQASFAQGKAGNGPSTRATLQQLKNDRQDQVLAKKKVASAKKQTPPKKSSKQPESPKKKSNG